MLQRNEYLEKYTESFRDEVHNLVENNKILLEDNKSKTTAVENLREVIYRKSQEVKKLMEDVNKKNEKNSSLCSEIQSLHEAYNKNINALNAKKSHELLLATQESQELLEKVKDYEDLVQKQESLTHSLHIQNEEYLQLKSRLTNTMEENKNLRVDIAALEKKNCLLLQENQKLQELNNATINNIGSLQEENNQYKMSLELTRKDSKILEEKLNKFEDLLQQLELLKKSHERLIAEKNSLENELAVKTIELDNAINAIQLTRTASIDLEHKLKNSENMNTNLNKVDEANKKLIKEQKQLQSELQEKKQAFDSLLQAYDDLRSENDRKTEEVDTLSRELESLKLSYKSLMDDKKDLQNDFENKNDAFNILSNTLESKVEENRVLLEQIKKLQNVEEDNLANKNILSALRKESNELLVKVELCEKLQSEYDQLKNEHDRIISENNELQRELKKMEKDNHDLNSESQILLSHSEDLEKALINARTQLVNTTDTRDSHSHIMHEIEELRKEKLQQHKRIRELRDKLEISENTISELSENVLARDYKISTLQNYINELQDEVQRLHISLADVVDAGEQIKDNSYQKINQSLQSMEAHHSRATHNMKMELAKLQNENINLEERLSLSKIKSEDSIRDKHRYLSQIVHLQNEREIIVTDIKQLEIKSVGDSALSPENCETENILTSLDRIRRYLDARCSKSMLLEQSILKAQNSYQLVQDKADEAKKIVEKEKQKILNEKEEAIRDRIHMEKQLYNLKEQLEKQVSHDKGVIKDLEAEILNQKLIIDKLDKSRQNYISKLKEEIQSLEELYRTAKEKISELENKLQLMSDEKNKTSDLLQNVKKQLNQKSEEVNQLQNDLNSIKNKVKRSETVQTLILEYNNVETQTESYIRYDDNQLQSKYKNHDNDIRTHGKKSDVYEAKNVPHDYLKPTNEVQVLTANVEPTFNFDKNNYLKHKLQKLSTGHLEQHSISASENNLEIENIIEPSSRVIKETISQASMIDIYNKRSMDTSSSKVADTNYLANETYLKSTDKTSGGLATESFDTKSSEQQKRSNMLGSLSGQSDDKDIFVIFKDSASNNDNKSHDKKSWPKNVQSDILVKATTIQSNKDRNIKKEQTKHRNDTIDPDSDPFLYQEEDLDDDSVKHKLKITLPRVDAESPTSASDADKKSLDSYSIVYKHNRNKKIKLQGEHYKSQSVHSMSNGETQYLESYISTEEEQTSKNENSGKADRNSLVVPSDSTQVNNLSLNTSPDSAVVKHKLANESRHRLSRIDADAQLLANSVCVSPRMGNIIKRDKKEHDHGLDYILNTGIGDPDNIKTYSAAQGVRETRSDQGLDDIIKIHNRNDSSPARLSPVKTSENNFKADRSPLETNTEGYVMVKMHTLEEYENKIRELTKYMENIERDYKKKLDVIKMQYDDNIRSILNEHNKGVKSIQSLHEDTLQDIMRHHENEVENLRSMSIDAMKRAEKLEKENKYLRCKMQDSGVDEEPIKISTPEVKSRRRSDIDTKMLSKTNVEAFNVRPKSRCNGPCTCSLDVNISDTIRNIFEQVDVEQRKIAEHSYLKHIANKILNSNVEALDSQELAFLHLKVCRIWKVKVSKEDTLQKRIDSLEAELISKQRNTQLNMAELDRKVAEERHRLQEVREAVCRNVPSGSRYNSPDNEGSYIPPVHAATTADQDYVITCNYDINERRSAGDLAPTCTTGFRGKRGKTDNRAVLARLDGEGRRERKLYADEPPTRLRRAHDRPPPRTNKK